MKHTIALTAMGLIAVLLLWGCGQNKNQSNTSTDNDTSTTTQTNVDVASVETGKTLAAQCLGCHTIDGSTGVGPSWKGLFGKTETLDDDSTVVVDEAYLKESISDPTAKVVKGYQGIMAAYQFEDSELDALIAYIKSLK